MDAGDSGGLLSGMANQNTNSPAAATAASTKKPALSPARTTTRPARSTQDAQTRELQAMIRLLSGDASIAGVTIVPFGQAAADRQPVGK
jgi:hypothetical protein